jgi:predicted membrane protein
MTIITSTCFMALYNVRSRYLSIYNILLFGNVVSALRVDKRETKQTGQAVRYCTVTLYSAFMVVSMAFTAKICQAFIAEVCKKYYHKNAPEKVLQDKTNAQVDKLPTQADRKMKWQAMMHLMMQHIYGLE